MTNEEFIWMLKEKLYPTNGTCEAETVHIDESWPEREEEAKKLRELLGLRNEL